MISFILLFGCYLVKSLSEKEFNLIAIFISFPFLYLIPNTFQGIFKVTKKFKNIKKGKGNNETERDEY